MRLQWKLTLAALLAMAGVAGCGMQSGGGSAASTGAVAIIDLDEVARRVGGDKQIAESLTQRQSALRQQLADLANAYRQQIAEQQKTLPAEPAEQSDVTLASWEQQANANFNQAKQQAELDLRNHRQRLLSEFREHVKPVARRVAQRRGLSVIVTKNESVVFDYVSTADITAEVVDELLANSATPAATPVATQTHVTAPPLPATAASAQPQRGEGQ